MPRRRKLVKPAERAQEAPQAPNVPREGPPPETASKGAPRRRLKRPGLHPAIAQFSGHPEAQEKVRQALAHNPNLSPTAFSWHPLFMGSALNAMEAGRVMRRLSIFVEGVRMHKTGNEVCRDCIEAASREALLVGQGYFITLFKPRPKAGADETLCQCLRCGGRFYGEADA